mmetsp:Transcript_34354/g.109725  ORF Transcript_34354/g.109725 Transcript_34354/m.109725 type:complete len:313 (+) Transcript_34354:1389-2327(+)
MAAPSVGEMAKRALSNSSALHTNPPLPAAAACTSLIEPMSTCSLSTHRTRGTARMPSPLASKLAIASPIASAPPGQRATSPPEIEMAFSAAAGDALAVAIGRFAPEQRSSSSRCDARARGVGWSNTIVGDTATPVRSRRREASSVAASESMPASISGVAAPMASTSLSLRTVSKTASSILVALTAGVNVASSWLKLLPRAFSVPEAAELDTAARSSDRRGTSALGTPSSMRAVAVGSGNRTATAALLSTDWSTASYSTREMASMPRKDICPLEKAAAPIPTPCTSGNCTLLATHPRLPKWAANTSKHELAEA